MLLICFVLLMVGCIIIVNSINIFSGIILGIGIMGRLCISIV